MEESEVENRKYLKWFNKIYPYYGGFSDDLLFYVAIATLFYTVVKGFSAQQIILLTTFSTIVSIVLRIPLIKLIQRIGSTKSIRISAGLVLLSSILITFGKSYFTIIVAKCLYEIALVFRNMLSVLLKSNLSYQDMESEFVRFQNKKSSIYAIITALIAIIVGVLFNINNYLPMYLCIFFCVIIFITSFRIKEVCNEHNFVEKQKVKVNFSKMICMIFISYGLFYGLITIGQSNGELFIQNELFKIYSVEQVTIYLSVIIFISRIARIISNLSFTKIYYKYKNKVNLSLGILMISAYLFIILGYFINNNILLKFIMMASGYIDGIRVYCYFND